MTGVPSLVVELHAPDDAATVRRFAASKGVEIDPKGKYANKVRHAGRQ